MHKLIERFGLLFGRLFATASGRLDGTLSKRKLHRLFNQLIKEGGPALADQMRILAAETSAFVGKVAPDALREASSGTKITIGGGLAGTVLGWILGGGSIGVVGLGLAVGIPVVVVTGILGTLIASFGYRELLPFVRQWLASVKRAETIQKFAQQAADDDASIGFLNGTREHRAFLLHQLDSAHRYLTIRSAFISSYAINDEFITKLRGALVRGVIVTIEYGYHFPGGGDDQDKAGRERATKRLIELQREAVGQGWAPLNVAKTLTHIKELAVDDLELAIGGFNWLSNASRSQKANAEKSIVIRHAQFAREVRLAAHEAADRFGAGSTL
ncbi:MAG: hypothetical protein R3D56_03590 [Paracoccaceae bacterium]